MRFDGLYCVSLTLKSTIIFSAASGNFLRYITAEYSNGKLTIFTLEGFINYEQEQTVNQMILLLNFDCTGNSPSLTFIQNITAVNNFDPEFSRSSYEIVIPTPLYPGLDVTIFLTVSLFTLTCAVF